MVKPRLLTTMFTTAAFDRSSLWLFGASPCRATPRGLPSSFVQHEARASSWHKQSRRLYGCWPLKGARTFAADCGAALRSPGFVSGHDFSRAENAARSRRALAPERKQIQTDPLHITAPILPLQYDCARKTRYSAMRVVAICGSYRQGGAIDQAVEAVLVGAREKGAETKTFHLREQHIEF